VPFGGAAIIDPGRVERPIEAVRKPLADLDLENGQLRRALLWPPSSHLHSDATTSAEPTTTINHESR
jgi:hypothetical protein